jgi:hypothetical protein
MDVEEIIDGLYARPLEEFTRERNQAERGLRKAGQREQAEQCLHYFASAHAFLEALATSRRPEP